MRHLVVAGLGQPQLLRLTDQLMMMRLRLLWGRRLSHRVVVMLMLLDNLGRRHREVVR